MKKLAVIFFCLCVGVVFFYSCTPESITMTTAMRDTFYTNPLRQKINKQDINIIVPSKEKTNGETFIARDLAAYFSKRGKNVNIIPGDIYYNKAVFTKMGHSINIILYGWVSFFPNKNGINILYLLYPSEKLTDITIKNYNLFDVTAVTSKTYLAKLKEKGINAVYIPQFTNTDIFFEERLPNGKDNVLFVGGNYTKRTSVDNALKTGINIAVYGKHWQEDINQKYGVDNINMYFKGKYIQNEQLHKHYSSADIVLNDHRPEMLENGFVSNRIYDVTACKGFVISDYLPEIEEIYGDSIPMWKNKEDFARLIKFYLAHPEERAKKSAKAHQITLDNFTIEKVGQMFEKEIERLAEQRNVK